MNDTSEENMVYYPAIDGRKERQIEPSVEILSQSGIHYFFSPGFKTSDIILELVVKKYGGESRGLKSLFRFGEESLVICFDFMKKRQIAEEVKSIQRDLFPDLNMGDVLACYKDEYDVYLLTKDELLSTYRDDNGDYLRVDIDKVCIEDNRIYDADRAMISDDHDFSAEFQNLFYELQLLGKDVKPINCRHPMRAAPLKAKVAYLEILLGDCLFDKYLSANEVVRIEILARQLGVSSQTVLNAVNQILRVRQISRDEKYLQTLIKKVSEISGEYHYVLFHDVIAFELLPDGEALKEDLSRFADELSKRCGLDVDFMRKYIEVMRKFIKGSYDINENMEKIRTRIANVGIADQIYDTIDFEYSVQQGMIRR